MKKEKRKLKKYIPAFFYSFGQSTKVLFDKQELCANLDPFYLYGIYSFINNIKKRKINLYAIIILIYSLIQLLFLPHIEIVKLFINVFKIIICIYIMQYVKEKYHEIDWNKFTLISTLYIFFITFISLILRNSVVLWRIGELFNDYDKVRLQGMFLEPSELGFHAVILLIFLFYYYLKTINKQEKNKYILLIIMNLITLYLAKPMGSVVLGFFSIILMIIIWFKQKNNILGILLTLLAVGLIGIVFIKTNSSIWLRIIDTLNGSDPSNNYRIGVSFNILKQSFIDYYGFGFGFGNLNTAFFNEKYSYLGLSQVVANSFQYFIIEGGIFSIIFLIILWSKLFKITLSSKNSLRYGLISFLFLYQIFGSHFTNGIIWFLYGLCLSKYEVEQ